MVILEITQDQLRAQIKAAVAEAIEEHFIPPQRDRLFSRKETADYLDVSLPTLNKWEETGELTPKRFGNRVYYHESDLLKKK